MNTIKILMFGHDVSKNDIIRNFLVEIGYDERIEINRHIFQITNEQIGNINTIMFGVCIADTNENYDSLIQQTNHEIYLNDYLTFLSDFIEKIKSNLGESQMFDEFANEAFLFFKNAPEFYTLITNEY